jgi:hypothetical protein
MTTLMGSGNSKKEEACDLLTEAANKCVCLFVHLSVYECVCVSVSVGGKNKCMCSRSLSVVCESAWRTSRRGLVSRCERFSSQRFS